jgi:hypothetical protein
MSINPYNPSQVNSSSYNNPSPSYPAGSVGALANSLVDVCAADSEGSPAFQGLPSYAKQPESIFLSNLFHKVAEVLEPTNCEVGGFLYQISDNLYSNPQPVDPSVAITEACTSYGSSFVNGSLNPPLASNIGALCSSVLSELASSSTTPSDGSSALSLGVDIALGYWISQDAGPVVSNSPMDIIGQMLSGAASLVSDGFHDAYDPNGDAASTGFTILPALGGILMSFYNHFSASINVELNYQEYSSYIPSLINSSLSSFIISYQSSNNIDITYRDVMNGLYAPITALTNFNALIVKNLGGSNSNNTESTTQLLNNLSGYFTSYNFNPTSVNCAQYDLSANTYNVLAFRAIETSIINPLETYLK